MTSISSDTELRPCAVMLHASDACKHHLDRIQDIISRMDVTLTSFPEDIPAGVNDQTYAGEFFTRHSQRVVFVVPLITPGFHTSSLCNFCVEKTLKSDRRHVIAVIVNGTRPPECISTLQHVHVDRGAELEQKITRTLQEIPPALGKSLMACIVHGLPVITV